MSYPRSFAGLAIVIILAACSTIDDIRTSEPVRTGTFEGNYDALSGCVIDALIGRMAVVQNIRANRQTATVTYISDNGFSRLPLWEATIMQADGKAGTVEMRAMMTMWDSPVADVALAWPVFERCGVTTMLAHRPVSQR